MAYLTKDQLHSFGFKRIGENVLISERAVIYNADQIEIGDNSRIDDFCVLSGKICIGRNVHLAVFTNLAGGAPGITLDDFSGIAYGCQIFAQSDDYSGRTMTNPTIPAEYKKETKRKVYIGRHVIIGANSVVLPGVNVAEGCSLGAQSLLTKSTEPWTIYFGVPAKKLKSRRKDLLELEMKFLASTEKSTSG